MLRVTSLGSGSKGNSTLVQYKSTNILVDSGFSCRELESRLSARGVLPQKVNAVLVTHEHSDHFKGVPAFANKYEIPVWMSKGTSLHPTVSKLKDLNLFNSHVDFVIGEINVEPILVPHDSREACQFVLSAEQSRVGILTDLGHITPFIVQKFQQLDALLIEFNHDKSMLLHGKYPPKLKSRVGGPLGHLSNEQALEFLSDYNCSRLKVICAMHLSEENNCAELVQSILEELTSGLSVDFVLADQNDGFDWIELV
ncbi:MAG: MBL fold metallo-hydrolase [Kangiellaceae bacterium]|nr:MBL fold metallo-hydrolase [Kangiellaceae bacterium]MCW9017354.1 MBL fold metallo-hydrolase [Kangiellaceae bacterium]